uniref:Uncharacterized protein n=1 Tax=viral metagenome TaxID=1070528 RepID=A0A6M3LAA7_9ZZZZ
MALTIAYEGLGVIANADLLTNDTGGLGTGDWGELGAGYIGTNPDVYLYGTGSIGSQYASKVGYSYFDRVTPVDFNSTWAGNFVYMWINISAKGAFTTADSFCIRLGTSNSANYNDYFIANKDDSNGWPGGWKLFVIDPTKTRTSGNGTLNLASVQYFGNYIATDVSVRADSIWWSQIAVAKGLRILGTSTTGWADAVAYCTDYPNRAWGVLQEREGIYYVYGGLWVGSSTASMATSFVTAGRVIQFGTSEYRNATTDWVTSYPNTANTLVVEDQNGYSTIFTDGVIVGSDAGRSGSQFIGDPNSTISMTLYSGNDASSVTKMYGTTFKDIKGTIILGANIANQYFSDTFQGCGIMTLGTSSVQNTLFVSQLGLITYGGGILKNCSFISATVPVALSWNVAVDTNTKLDGTLFSSGGTGHAIEFGTNTPTSLTFNNLTFTGYGSDETTDAAIYNNSGKAIEISLNGTTQPTVKNGGGASTTFPSSITLKIAVKDIEGNPMGSVRCYIDDNNQTPFILDDVTDGTYGEASTSYTGSPVTNATWRVRKYGYYPFQQLVSIASSDITLPVTLVADPLQT